MTLRKFRRKIQKALFREQWSLVVCDGNGSVLAQIVPPRDRIWADPFPVEFDGHYYIFIEQQFTGQNGTLGYIELFDDLTYSDFVPILERDYHLSYPHVFLAGNEWYMVPETNEHGSIDLYRATEFPAKWVFDRTLIPGVQAVDSTVYFHDGLWYLFTSIQTPDTDMNGSLFLFFSRSFPSSIWEPCARNPIKKDRGNGRMAGRIFRDQSGSIIRPAQSCKKEYGEKIILNNVTELSPEHYEEKTIGTIMPERHLHAVCTHTWNACGKYVIRDIKTRICRLLR